MMPPAAVFEIAGGSIRNIALAAAFLAADDGNVITMSHLMHATKREFQKMGKVVTEGQFFGESVVVARTASEMQLADGDDAMPGVAQRVVPARDGAFVAVGDENRRMASGPIVRTAAAARDTSAVGSATPVLSHHIRHGSVRF